MSVLSTLPSFRSNPYIQCTSTDNSRTPDHTEEFRNVILALLLLIIDFSQWCSLCCWLQSHLEDVCKRYVVEYLLKTGEKSLSSQASYLQSTVIFPYGKDKGQVDLNMKVKIIIYMLSLHLLKCRVIATHFIIQFSKWVLITLLSF